MTEAGDGIVRGYNESRFDPLRSALADAIASGEEVGAAISVDIAGETVVDIWGGHADDARTVGWEHDTIVNVWSCTKTITSLAALILVDRGLIDLSAPVARYWPEFAANGKRDIMVRQILSHTSGVSGWEAPICTEDIYDWDTATARLAAQAPWWAPGTAAGYHALNYGHLTGEIVRRVTGMSLREFVDSEVAGPLGADFQIGARPQDHGRVAEIVAHPPPKPPPARPPEGSTMRKTFAGSPPDAGAANTAAWRAADLGAMNGHGNARSLVRMLSPISLGGNVGGVGLLRRETIDGIFEVQAGGVDLALGVPLRWGIGYGLPMPGTFPYIPDERICFWVGWGGSVVLADPDRRTTIAYVMNKMGPGRLGSDRTARYVSLVYRTLASGR